MGERLRDPGGPTDAAFALAGEHGITITAAAWLDKRGFVPGSELERWLDPKLAHLTPPDAMADLGPAVERIAFAINRGERIAVFGDYDCDGITSCAIMTEVLRELGGDVVPLLASRFDGGYGFSAAALAKVRDSGATLLVTCDCGSTDHERLEGARSAGIDSVVIDHHLVPEQPLPAVAFLNPHRPVCGFPFKGLASCGLALLVATQLRKATGKALDVRRWLDLVAVGTIADVAPLTDDNRALVRAGLKVLSGGARVGLSALVLAGSNGRRRPLSAQDVAFQVAPRINAPGRLGSPDLALEVLLARDPARAWELGAEIDELTMKRREIQQRMTLEAEKDVEERGYGDDPALVLGRQEWHPGVVGIVAGRLADSLRRPVIVVALEGDSGRGSARAPAGFRIYDALSACRDELIGFGGHQAAAGVEVRSDRLDRFREAFCRAAAAQLAGAPPPPSPALCPDVRLDERDDLMAVLADLERLEPCGEGNPAPRLLVPEARVISARDLKGHARLEVEVYGTQLGAFAPGRGPEARGLVGRSLHLSARLKRDHFRGGTIPELLVDAFDAP